MWQPFKSCHNYIRTEEKFGRNRIVSFFFSVEWLICIKASHKGSQIKIVGVIREITFSLIVVHNQINANQLQIYWNKRQLQITRKMGKDGEDPEVASLPAGFGSSFSDKSIRMRFVKKVYSILLIQFLVTTGIVALVILSPIRGLMCRSR